MHFKAHILKSFIKSNLSIFPLIACGLVLYLRKSCLFQGHEGLHPCFFLRVFPGGSDGSKSSSASALTLKPLIHFELNFEDGVREETQFHSFVLWIPGCPSIVLLKRLFFPH